MGGATTLVVRTKEGKEALKLELRITNESGVSPFELSRMEGLSLEGGTEVLSNVVKWAAGLILMGLIKKEQLVPTVPA